ncbi:MAG: hypothetical protein KF745_00255 [Phycisphaeraceae bacterium]|nr:hypothetical protein [Phycisphaeraceae bacterium]
MKIALTAAASAVACVAAPALAQSVAIDLTGVQIRNAVTQSRQSTATLLPAQRYRIVVAGNVQGSPLSLLGILYPSPTPLAQVLETFAPGASQALDTTSTNPTTPPSHPFAPAPVTQGGTTTILSTTVTFSATIASGIGADNKAFFSLTNVVITPSTVGYLTFTSGSATVTRIPCPVDYWGDRNGQVEPTDIAVFVAAWLNSISAGTLGGDYDLNGTVEPSDIAAYVGQWFAAINGGGCPS